MAIISVVSRRPTAKIMAQPRFVPVDVDNLLPVGDTVNGVPIYMATVFKARATLQSRAA